jgi:hypothetical protein
MGMPRRVVNRHVTRVSLHNETFTNILSNFRARPHIEIRMKTDAYILRDMPENALGIAFA